MLKVVLYSNHNGNCEKLQEFLDESNVNYCLCDEEDEVKNVSSFPVLDINGKKLNFKSAIKWVKEKK